MMYKMGTRKGKIVADMIVQHVVGSYSTRRSNCSSIWYHGKTFTYGRRMFFADVVIKAVTESGNIDEEYEWDVWIEVRWYDYTDPDITLPWGGTIVFTKADRWQLRLSKSIKFAKPGDYNLEAVDVYNNDIDGGIGIIVEWEPEKEANCGPRHNTDVYSNDGEWAGLTKDTVWLCDNGLAQNFIFDRLRYARQWLCLDGASGETVACHANALWCGDGEHNGPEMCEADDTGSCRDDEVCTSSCACVPNNESGVCGEFHASEYYSQREDESWLKWSRDDFCLAGSKEDASYDPLNSLLSWVCEGMGEWEDVVCFAARSWCGDGRLDEQEQCDDGNSSSGDGCSSSCRPEGIVWIGWPVSQEWCGNAVVEVGEQCDDGNLRDDDGCTDHCSIEKWWKCTMWSPSTCGSIECSWHGEWFTEYNISGACCGGLEASEFQQTPEKLIASGVQLTICYDPTIDEPVMSP